MFDIHRTVYREKSATIKHLKTTCLDSHLPVPETVLSVLGLTETGIVATAFIKIHVVDNSTLVYKVVDTMSLRRPVSQNASLTIQLVSERFKVASLKTASRIFRRM